MVKYIRDYYKILDVKSDSDKSEIKKAYKKAVVKYHPDVNNDENANEKFNLIQEAYEVLSDENKRVKYDKLLNSAKFNYPKVKSKSNLTKYKKDKNSNTLDKISKGVDLAVELENEVGLFSNALSTIMGNNKRRSFSKSGKLSKRNSSKHNQYRHRRKRRM